MLGIDRRAARYTWTAALVLLLLWLVYLVRATVFIFILALLFAYLLSPLVNFLDRVIPSRTRAPALALSYLIFVGLVVFLGIQIGSRVVEQATNLGKTFPQMIANWEKPSPNASAAVNSLKQEAIEKIRTSIGARSGDLVSAAAHAGVKFLTVASDLIYVVIIPILAFFFLKDARVMRQHILDLVEDGPRRALLDDVLADVHLLLAHYMRALVLLSLASFTAYSIFFSIGGVPYAILLGALGGILEFIPMLGPLTAGVTILIVGAVSGGPVLVILIFLLAYRVFQDYVLSPHLMGQGVEVHPLLVLFGVFAGAEVAGIPGTFLSVPVLALVRIIYLRIRKSRLGSQLSPTPAGSVRL
ncbi:MAG TPA: AI-2E family transporter [Bryobacteraceae bacterium]